MARLQNKASIHDVARTAGVSLKTVSRVLNDEDSVRPETAVRVRKAAERLGYTVTLAARQLRSGRSRNIGIVLVSRNHWQWTADLVAGALETCQARGYGLQPFVLSEYASAERDALLHLVARKAVDGLVLTTPWNELSDLRADLAKRKVPCVLVPAAPKSGQLTVRAQEADGVAELTRTLIQFGHRRFGIVAGQKILDGTQQRLAGFRRALKEAGLPYADVPSVFRDYVFETGYVGGLQLLRMKSPPSAIIAFTDVLAAGVVRAAFELNVDVPRQLSVAGVGNYDVATMISPRLTTVDIPSQAMTAKAVDMLIDSIEGATAGYQEAVFDAKVLLRESVSSPPTTANRVQPTMIKRLTVAD